MMFAKGLRLALACAVVLALAMGCDRGDIPGGAAASVNGRIITMAQLERAYDNRRIDPQGSIPSVETLRSDYGDILSGLVADELMRQELERQGFSVTDGELEAAEADIRKDYPDDSFERMLAEEVVDLSVWREQLRIRLSEEKFRRLVLRPGARIEAAEAESYYREHLAEFRLSERVEFLLVSSPTRELLEKAKQLMDKGAAPEEIATRLPRITIRTLKMRVDSLPADMHDSISRLAEGESSAIQTGDDLHQRVVLLKRIPAKVLDPSQAYPLVERVLLERKLASAYEAWLENALERADVRINARILEKTAEEPSGGEAGSEPAAPPGGGAH